MDKQIILSDEKKKEIATTFGYSRQTVWAALTYQTNSPVAKMLRKAALERGGVSINGSSPAFETVFHTSENLMVQTFSSRVRLTADLSTGEVKVYTDNDVVSTHSNPRINELPAIQQKAQFIANQLKSNL